MPPRRLLILIGLAVALLMLLPGSPASAQNFGAYDLIAAVNALRASQGLAPYTVDAELMAYAQEHSEYQASTDTSTHQHSDGQNSLSRGYLENVAGGDIGYLTVDAIVNQIWADPVHMKTMVGYASGYVGAGVAASSTTVYVTLNVLPGDGAAPAAASASGADAQATLPLQQPLVTATPLVDGSIVHVVGYGEALWSIAIAYGVRIDDIRNLNGLPPGSTNIYSGQRLIIRPAGQVTATFTPQAPTSTSTQAPTATRPPSPTATRKPTLTPTPTPAPPLTRLPGRKAVAITLLMVGAAGFFIVLYFGFRK
ncbi:MAG: CAP domain-containing protein [Anaerolineales bacterium]|nr:CAP domain-containing protein [Anaerolineales bacterium]